MTMGVILEDVDTPNQRPLLLTKKTTWIQVQSIKVEIAPLVIIPNVSLGHFVLPDLTALCRVKVPVQKWERTLLSGNTIKGSLNHKPRL